MISRKSKFRFGEKLRISQESLRSSVNKESGTNEKCNMTLTIVWHDVVVIADPVKMVYSDRSFSTLLYIQIIKKRIPPSEQIRNPPPPSLTIFRPNLIPHRPKGGLERNPLVFFLDTFS